MYTLIARSVDHDAHHHHHHHHLKRTSERKLREDLNSHSLPALSDFGEDNNGTVTHKRYPRRRQRGFKGCFEAIFGNRVVRFGNLQELKANWPKVGWPSCESQFVLILIKVLMVPHSFRRNLGAKLWWVIAFETFVSLWCFFRDGIVLGSNRMQDLKLGANYTSCIGRAALPCPNQVQSSSLALHTSLLHCPPLPPSQLPKRNIYCSANWWKLAAPNI